MIPRPQLHEFAPANALACARWALAAYWTPTGALAALRQAGALEIEFLNAPRTGTQAFLARAENSIVLAFRGTEPGRFNDLLTDLMACRRHGVHRGFLAAWESIASEAYAVLARWQAEAPRPIFITGHSLGGALAILCAETLAGNQSPHLRPTAVYTFGQPRVFAAERARQCDARLRDRTHCLVNEEDVVARLPLWIWGYRHVGAEHFLSSFDTLLLNPPLWQKLFSDFLGFWHARTRAEETLLLDHCMQGYLARLEQVAQAAETPSPAASSPTAPTTQLA